MAKKTKGSLLDKALKGHAEDETDYSSKGENCPPGIKGGIARLSKAHIGTFESGDNQGERFVYLGATVIKPEDHTYIPKIFEKGKRKNLKPVTVSTRGLLTSPGTFPLCEDSRGDHDENVATALNMIRMVGGEECTAEIASSSTPLKTLEGVLKDLLEEKPYIGFTTRGSNVSAKYPEERTWENWSGAVDHDEEESDDDPEEDEEEDEEEESEEEEEEESNLTTLAALADDDDDEDAQTKLERLAVKCELDPNNYDTWADLATAIEESNEEEEEEDEEEPPERGQIYSYRPSKAKSDMTVEVTRVARANETCNVRAVENGKLYKGVPWARLTVEE